MGNYKSDWSRRLDVLLFGENLDENKKDISKAIRVKYKDDGPEKAEQSNHNDNTVDVEFSIPYKEPPKIPDSMEKSKMAAAFVDTRNYVASADMMENPNNEDTENQTPKNDLILHTTGPAFTRSRGTGPYGQVAYQKYNKHYFTNRRGLGVGTSGKNSLHQKGNS